MTLCCAYINPNTYELVLRQCSTGSACPDVAGLTKAEFQIDDCSQCDSYPDGRPPDGPDITPKLLDEVLVDLGKPGVRQYLEKHGLWHNLDAVMAELQAWALRRYKVRLGGENRAAGLS